MVVLGVELAEAVADDVAVREMDLVAESVVGTDDEGDGEREAEGVMEIVVLGVVVAVTEAVGVTLAEAVCILGLAEGVNATKDTEGVAELVGVTLGGLPI